jgi:hypothetical protein
MSLPNFIPNTKNKRHKRYNSHFMFDHPDEQEDQQQHHGNKNNPGNHVNPQISKSFLRTSGSCSG